MFTSFVKSRRKEVKTPGAGSCQDQFFGPDCGTNRWENAGQFGTLGPAFYRHSVISLCRYFRGTKFALLSKKAC